MNVVDSPFHLVCKHSIHVRDDLDGHVDQALAEDQADVGVGLRKEGLQGCMEGGVGDRRFFEGVTCDGFY